MIDYSVKEERFALARRIAEEGIVMLRNDGMLPLSGAKTAIFGRMQVDTIKCGIGSAFCVSEYVVDILTGMENEKLDFDRELAETYKDWCAKNSVMSFGVWGNGSHSHPEMPVTDEMIAKTRENGATKALFIVGRVAGENQDFLPMKGAYYLTDEEEDILDRICKVYDEVCVIVNSGNLMDCSFADRDEVKAILFLNFPGMEGGNALARILSGAVSPSAKLTDTIAMNYEDYPSSAGFGKRGGIIQKYTDDIFVGYRYFETMAKDKVRFPFGFGLSYADFKMETLSFEANETDITATVRVKNVSDTYAGKEVVMLYSSSPKTALGKPAYELRGFAKTGIIPAGGEETVTVSFKTESMASFDDTGITGEKDAWVMEKGAFTISLGNNVRTLKTIGTYENPAYKVLQKCTHLPTQLEQRMTVDGTLEALDFMPPDPDAGIIIPAAGVSTIAASDYYECSGDPSSLKAGESVTYKLDISASGPYIFNFAIEGSDTITEHYDVFLNRAPFDFDEGNKPILTPGTLRIVLVAKEDAPPALISFTLERNDAPVPISAEGVSYIEGGNYVENALWVARRPFDDPEGAIKRGYALFRMHTPGRFALYHLHVEKAGFYDIRLRVAHRYGAQDIRETYSFLVSNVTQDIESVIMPNTYGEDEKPAYATTGPIQLALPAGDCYLRVISVTKNSPMLAYMEVTPSDRVVHLTGEDNVDTGMGNDEIAEEWSFTRRELPPVASQYDFRRVLSGACSMDDFIGDLTSEELAILSCGNVNTHIGLMSHRGIPECYWADGPVGLRLNVKTTVYPAGTMVASSFNTELAFAQGLAIGKESHHYHVDVWLAPALNIHRNPCCGRNFEYMAEDPVVSGLVTAAMVKGVQSQNVAATIKHFTANNTEYRRMASNSQVSARALREVYMRGFEIAVRESDPYSIMTSYNLINGTKVSENPLFCTGVIREDFGYTGMLMSDFANDSNHVKELAAGQDLKMHFGDIRSVTLALAEGTLDRAGVRACIKRILEFIIRTTVQNDEYFAYLR